VAKRTASADLDKASTPTTSTLGIFTARAAVLAAGGLAAFAVGPWAAVTFGITLPPVLFAAAIRRARRSTPNHPQAQGSDDPSASITASARTRREGPGSHSGTTGPDESAAGDHGFDCLMCDYPWRTVDGCGYCTWKPGDSIGFAGIEFDAGPVPVPTTADVQRVACPVCDWKPIDGCIHLDGTNPEHGMCREDWCQFCTWTAGDECPNCTYPTRPMRSARDITDAMTTDERQTFRDDLLAFTRRGAAVTADGLVSAEGMTPDELAWCAELNRVDTGTDPDGAIRRERHRAAVRRWIWRYLAAHLRHTRHAA